MAAYRSGHQAVHLLVDIIVDGPRSVSIRRSTPERAWLDDGQQLTCTADSNPPAAYDWTELATGAHLYKGAVLVVDTCRMFGTSAERNASKREVMLRCTASVNNHSIFTNITALIHASKPCRGSL